MSEKKEDLMNESLTDEMEVLENAETPNDEPEILQEEADEVEEVDNLHESEEEEAAQDGEEEIFPFGPTYNDVADWKSRFNGEVYMSDFNNKIYVWRPIRRNEYRNLQRVEGAANDAHYIEEAITRTCVLWPEDYAAHEITFGHAGVPSMLSELILERSGFLRPATVKL